MVAIKRLSISRRVDLIFAFFRDARTVVLRRSKDADEQNQRLAREVQRQIENAILADREARDGTPLEFTDGDLCPACGIPIEGHGLIEIGKWQTRICAGVSGQNLFIIGPEAAQVFVEQLKEKDERTAIAASLHEKGDGAGDSTGPDTQTEGALPVSADVT